MENGWLIALIALLFVLGFIPVFFFNKFMNSNRRYVMEGTKPQKKRRCRKKEEPLEEFDRTGELFFDPLESEGKKDKARK